MTARPFSAAVRHENLESVAAGVHDVLVVGGGITGAAVARDAALRGLGVALVEAGDIGGGTSSRSSRLIHGGLRYLETLEFGLVFEALRERRLLLEQAPHLVRPLPFIYPVYRGDPAGLVKLGAGMWLYESLSLFRAPKRHQMMGRSALLREEPGLRAEGLTGGARYHDAQVDDARLTLAVARGAHDAGAIVVPYARVVALEPKCDGASGAVVEDARSGASTRIRARLVINATGPWGDRLRSLADPSAPQRLRTTKGVHVLLKRDRVGNRHAIIFRSPLDGRVMFVLPWGDFTYIGTTDTESAGDPGAASADPADLRYLLESASALFPGALLREADVLSTWTGVRPLLAPGGAGRSESATSREHEIWRDPGGLLNVAGGKLTTFRSMAAETVDRAAGILRREFDIESGQCYTEYMRLPGAPEEDWDEFVAALRERVAGLGLPRTLADHLAGRHGDDAHSVLDLVASEPALGAPLAPGHPYLAAEAIHAVRAEMATTLEDVLRRRTQLFYESKDGGLTTIGALLPRLATEPGLLWDGDEIHRQVERYRAAVAETRPGQAVRTA